VTRRRTGGPLPRISLLPLWLAVASCAGQPPNVPADAQGNSDVISIDSDAASADTHALPGEADSGIPPSEPCPPGMYDDDDNDGTACRTWTDCPPGSDITASGTARTDRACTWCAPGSYSTQTNASTCVAWTDCPAGQYVRRTGTRTSDQSCASCPDGQRSTSQNASSCIDIEACPAGTEQTVPATATAPPSCTPCTPGTFCAGGSTAAQVCAGDTWDHDQNPASTCVPRTSCGPGRAVAAAGSASVDRTCEACPPGTYTSETNAAVCVAWTPCQSGQYVTLAGSAVHDRACASCPSGQFSVTSNAVQCTTWRDCEAGKHVGNTPSATADRQCNDCDVGTFTTQPNQTVCLPGGTCPAGTEQIASAGPTGAVTCLACPPGTYCAGAGAVKQLCIGDSWDHDASATTVCVPRTRCGPGRFVSGPGSSVTDRTCALCPVGSYSSGMNAVSCAGWTICRAGVYVIAAGTSTSNRACAPCPSGRFVDAGPNAASCTVWSDCAPGTSVTITPSATVDRGCAACAGGTFADQANQSMCLPQGTCAAGTEQTAAGTSSMSPVCAACPHGTYCAGTNTPQEPCDTSSWDDDDSASTACVARTDCGAGQYVTGTGSATTDRTCSACATGSYSSGINAGTCAAWTTCQPGEHIGTPGTAIADALCLGCASGRFSATTDASTCELWADCPAGKYVTNTPSTTVDRTCADCGAGTYTAQANQSTCLPQGTCAAGTEQTAAGTSTMSPTCATCSAGNYCAGGSTPAAPCATGTWDHDGSAATTCATQTTCGAGGYVLDPGSTTSDRVCDACAAGSYSTGSNAGTCTAWTTCQAGAYVSAAGTATTDRGCTTCPAGQTTTTTNAVACQSLDDPPVAVDDHFFVPQDSVALGLNVLLNDTDTDGGPKAVASITSAAHGVVAITGGGTGVSYTPTASYLGPDSFTYTLNGNSSATVTITVSVSNLVIYRVGDGVAALTANATKVFLDEYDRAGTLRGSIAVPTTTIGANRRLTASGSATTEGLLSLSTDGRYLIFPGYDAAVGTATLTTSTSATVPRVIGRADSDLSLDTTTALTDALSGGNPRSATSTNGTDLWISGTSSGGGVRYATFGATTSTAIAATPTNLRVVNTFGGQLFVTSQSGAFRLATIGTGAPTTTGQTITNLPGFPTATGSPYGFFFADLDAGVAGLDTLYVADDGGTVGKYSLVSGSWTLNGTASAVGIRGLTAEVTGTTVTLFVTSATSLRTLTDTGGYNQAISAAASTLLAAAGTNTAFRGVAFRPHP
jgi:hypothetical protein